MLVLVQVLIPEPEPVSELEQGPVSAPEAESQPLAKELSLGLQFRALHCLVDARTRCHHLYLRPTLRTTSWCPRSSPLRKQASSHVHCEVLADASLCAKTYAILSADSPSASLVGSCPAPADGRSWPAGQEQVRPCASCGQTALQTDRQLASKRQFADSLYARLTPYSITSALMSQSSVSFRALQMLTPVQTCG